jgi:hypothetical protein
LIDKFSAGHDHKNDLTPLLSHLASGFLYGLQKFEDTSILVYALTAAMPLVRLS